MTELDRCVLLGKLILRANFAKMNLLVVNRVKVSLKSKGRRHKIFWWMNTPCSQSVHESVFFFSRYALHFQWLPLLSQQRYLTLFWYMQTISGSGMCSVTTGNGEKYLRLTLISWQRRGWGSLMRILLPACVHLRDIPSSRGAITGDRDCNRGLLVCGVIRSFHQRDSQLVV